MDHPPKSARDQLIPGVGQCIAVFSFDCPDAHRAAVSIIASPASLLLDFRVVGTHLPRAHGVQPR